MSNFRVKKLTIAQVVSLGEYLLSEGRTERIKNHPSLTDEQKADSLKRVSHADIQNWHQNQTTTSFG